MDNPYVSSSIKRLRKRLLDNQSEVDQLKGTVKEAVQTGVDQFLFKLQSGQVQIDTVADFEKLAKLGLLVHGEATEKIEHTTDVEEIQEEHLHAVKETPEFDAFKKLLALQMNKTNQKEG